MSTEDQKRTEEIGPGDRVLCRTADGDWWETTAHSGVRVDREQTLRSQPWPSIAVGPWGPIAQVNWPAEDVLPATPQPEGTPNA